jgi:hypothetical protein
LENQGKITLPPFNVFFTTGETVCRPEAQFPDGGILWNYVPPCVSLDFWSVTPSAPDAAFTTVSHWNMDEGMVEGTETYSND